MVRKSSVETIEQLANIFSNAAKHKDQIPGGMADKKKPKDFSKKQLEMGQKVEMEHTNDPTKAVEISMDHLEEFPGEYYTALDEMEKKLEKGKDKKKGKKKEKKASRGCPHCGFEGEPGGAVYDVTFPCPKCGKGGVQL